MYAVRTRFELRKILNNKYLKCTLICIPVVIGYIDTEMKYIIYRTIAEFFSCSVPIRSVDSHAGFTLYNIDVLLSENAGHKFVV